MSRAPMRTDGTKVRNSDVQSPNAPARANAQRLRAETWAGGTKAMDAHSPRARSCVPRVCAKFLLFRFSAKVDSGLGTEESDQREEPPERHWQ